MSAAYRGRFAPTPSGPLHLGSLLAALGSWLDARAGGGEWLLRMDDLDAPRCPPGTDRTILEQLRAHGLEWDGEVHYQSAHLADYDAALSRLRQQDLVYRCSCTRARLALESGNGPDGPVYGGRCRTSPPPPRARCSLRLRTGAGVVAIEDAGAGRVARSAPGDIGDFVIQRNDGIIAYQLSCAVDEGLMGITNVVRGADLLGSTFRQLLVMRALEAAEPAYRHLPVLTAPGGGKLSKQNHAAPLENQRASANLLRCLAWLGQEANGSASEAPATVLRRAVESWNPERIPRTAQILVECPV